MALQRLDKTVTKRPSDTAKDHLEETLTEDKKQTSTQNPNGAATEIEALQQEIARLNDHRFLKTYNSLPRLLAFNFARGLAFGLGTVLGASILVSILAFSLREIDFIPIIGDWAASIAQQMEEAVE
jgi:hypothetical protein